jgi:hypothetical protein
MMEKSYVFMVQLCSIFRWTRNRTISASCLLHNVFLTVRGTKWLFLVAGSRCLYSPIVGCGLLTFSGRKA